MPQKDSQTVAILGIPVFSNSKQVLLEMIRKEVSEDANGQLFWINTPNSEQLVQAYDDDSFRSVLSGSTINIPDGIGLVLASYWLSLVGKIEQTIKGRISGVDLMEDLCKMSSKLKLNTFLLGGKGQVAEFAAQKLRTKYSSLKVAYRSGSLDIKNETEEESLAVLEEIGKNKTEVLFVAYGAPYQELWVDKHKKELEKMGVKLVMVVGGSFDVISGNIVRAPLSMRRIGLEWLWRLVQEPWRWRRQLRILKFLWLVVSGG